MLGSRAATGPKDSFFPETIQSSRDGGRAGALTGCAEVLWLPVRTSGRAFGLEPSRAGSMLLGQSRSRALAFRERGRAPQHVLRTRDVEETVGADADFDLQNAARVKLPSWPFRS